MPDPHDLQRFVDAQKNVYDDVRRELRQGLKQSHWMWFIFPQIKGLGFSSMAARFAISSTEEARAYLQHAILGARLRECTSLVLRVENRDVEQIFGYPDDLKFRSSMTLFGKASGEEIFQQALDKYFMGEPDSRTLELLNSLP